MIFKVAIAKGSEYQSTTKALKLIKSQIVERLKIKKPKTIFLKPNLVFFDGDWLLITKLDTVRAVVDFFNKLGVFQYIVADSSATIWGWSTKQILNDSNYWQLEKQYPNLKIIDLNDTPQKFVFKAKTIVGEFPIKMSKMALESEFLVSLAKLKTHDAFLNSLSIKNIVQGIVHAKCKTFIHGRNDINFSHPVDKIRRERLQKTIHFMHYNLYQGAKIIYPDLAIIDGVEAIEGNANFDCQKVNLGITIASLDALSADIVGTKIMNLNPKQIPYLDILKDERKPKLQVLGERIKDVKRNFKLHKDYPWMAVKKEKILRLIKQH